MMNLRQERRAFPVRHRATHAFVTLLGALWLLSTTAAALPHARLVVFPKAHHVPMDSAPPLFARTLREFCEMPATE